MFVSALVLPSTPGPVAAWVAVLAVVIMGATVARLLWQRFVSVRHLSRKFVAWELQFLADQSPHSFEEIRRFLITQSGMTEEHVERFLSESQKRRWDSAFQRSLATIEELQLTRPAGQNFCELIGLGYWVAEKRKAPMSRRAIKGLAKSYQKEIDILMQAFPADVVPPPPMGAPPMSEMLPPLQEAAPEPADIKAGFDELVKGPLPQADLEPPAEGNIIEKPKRFPVWFATNRKPNDPDNIAKGFGRRRGDRTIYGRCTVNIPKGHATGETQPTLLERWIEGKEGIVVEKIEGLPENDFWAALTQSLQVDPSMNSMLLFIHGFNVKFVEAAIRTGQLKYDLGMDHAAFFCWPSLRRLWGYGADSTSAREATPALAAFLEKLAAVTANEKINLHVIAHSMGNEAFLYAMERVLLNLKGDAAKFRLAEVVFAAPDVDASIFRDKTTVTIDMSRQRTLYASRKDIPLGFSGRILRRKMVRAGKIPPVTVVKRIDTIDVTDIDLSLLGHGYVAETRPVITDMSVAMHYGAVPAKRTGLEGADSPAGRYWIIG